MKHGIRICVAAAVAAAASARAAGVPEPTAPAAAVPPAQYESAFSEYRSYRDEKPAAWRDVNDAVARIGGHAGALRGAPASSEPHHTPRPDGGRK